MPFHNSGKTHTNSSDAVTEEERREKTGEALEDDEEDDAEEEAEREEATSWLENLGVETSQFPNLNPNRVSL